MTSSDKSIQAHDFLQGQDIHSRWRSDYLNADIDRFYDLVFDHIVGRLDLTSDSSILDAGCGQCHHIVRLARRFSGNIVGVDFSDAALAAGRRTVASAGINDRVTLQKGDLTALQFQRASFDAVISWGVLMHIPRLETALRELIRVLRPGGYMALSENNMSSLDAQLREAVIRTLKTITGAKNSTTVRTDWGLEVWYSMECGGLLNRFSNMRYLVDFFAGQGLTLIERRACQFSEAYVNLPNRNLKKLVYRLNEWYFRRGLSPSLAQGNILLFRKMC